MKRSLLAAILFGATSAFSVAQDAPQEPDILQLEGVATLVNDEPISFHDIRQRVRMLAMTVGAEITPEVQQQLANTAREQLVDEILQMQAVSEFNVEISDRQIQSAVDDLAARAGVTREELYTQFAHSGINPTTLESQMRSDIAWRNMMSGLYGCLLYTSPSPRDQRGSRMPSSA